uniref:Uncharacterized protein n=1 Tax=Opuntia streptacantha TaxID=393608 RepID=A0A7C9AGP0_OPUST
MLWHEAWSKFRWSQGVASEGSAMNMLRGSLCFWKQLRNVVFSCKFFISFIHQNVRTYSNIYIGCPGTWPPKCSWRTPQSSGLLLWSLGVVQQIVLESFVVLSW